MRYSYAVLAAALSAALIGGTSMAATRGEPVFTDGFEQPGDFSSWAFSNGPEFPGASGSFQRVRDRGKSGSYAGKLSFSFAGGNYVEAAVSLPEGKGIRQFRLWILKPVANKLTMRCTDSEGQTFQKSLNFAYRGWQEVSVSLGGWSAHWGGANDGVFRGDPTRLGVIVENDGQREGAVHIDDLRGYTETGKPAEGYSASYTVASFSAGERWGVTGAGDITGSAWSAPVLHFDFSKGGTAAGIETDIPIMGRPSQLVLEADCDGSGHEVRVRLGSHFQSFDKVVGRMDSRGPVRWTVDMAGLKGWRFYGGENDGVPQYPLRLTGVIVDSTGQEVTGDLRLRSLTIETQVPPEMGVVMVPATRVADGKAHFSLDAVSFLASRADGALSWRVRDWYGREVSRGSKALPMSAGGKASAEVSEAMDGRLFLESVFEYMASGQKFGPATTCAVVPQPPHAGTGLEPDSPFGMGLYLYRYPPNEEGYALMGKAASLGRDAGVKWSREEFQWHRIEPEKGRFDWTYYDRLVDTANRNGISVYGLIAYWSHWTKPYTQQGVQDYAAYCRALVTHFKDRIKHWEVWNEPNIFFWSGPKELYADLLKAAYGAIKEADPEAHVLGCSTAGIDTGFVRMVLDAGAPFDILTVHPYRGSLDERGFMKELQDASKLAAGQDGKGKPVWITEMGLPTQLYGGLSERNQATFLSRCYLSAVASGVDTNVSWYDFREDGENPFYNEHRFGVVRHADLAPKPGYNALATVCRTLAGRRVRGEMDLGDGVLAFRFSGMSDEVVAVWSPGADRLLSLRCTASDRSRPELMGVMGELVPAVWAGDRCLLPLQANAPVFVRGHGLSIAPAESLVSLEVPGSAHAGETVEIVCRIGPGLKPGNVALHGPEGWRPPERVARSRNTVSFRMTIPDGEPEGRRDAMLSVTLGASEIVMPVGMDVVPVLVRI